MTKKTLEQLQETHSEMLATAHDIGFSVPEELKTDFTELGAGATIVKNLDALIREHQKKAVAEAGEKVHTEASVETAVKKPSTKKAAAKKPKKASSQKPKAADTPPPKREEEVMAKKAKKVSKKSGGGKRVSFDPKSKITWLGKDNPAQKGSGKFDRIEGVHKASGKTVETFLAKGRAGTLGWCVKNGLAKVA